MDEFHKIAASNESSEAPWLAGGAGVGALGGLAGFTEFTRRDAISGAKKNIERSLKAHGDLRVASPSLEKLKKLKGLKGFGRMASEYAKIFRRAVKQPGASPGERAFALALLSAPAVAGAGLGSLGGYGIYKHLKGKKKKAEIKTGIEARSTRQEKLKRLAIAAGAVGIGTALGRLATSGGMKLLERGGKLPTSAVRSILDYAGPALGGAMVAGSLAANNLSRRYVEEGQ